MGDHIICAVPKSKYRVERTGGGENRMLKDVTALTIGLFSLAAGILLGMFTHFQYDGFSISAFLSGLLIGLSLVMNLYYLWRRGKSSGT
jgi:uncharacterized membrane-anchored protein